MIYSARILSGSRGTNVVVDDATGSLWAEILATVFQVLDLQRNLLERLGTRSILLVNKDIEFVAYASKL